MEDSRVPRYTHGHHASVLRSHARRTAENSAAYLLPELEAGMRVLDVGCGPGSITLDLADRVGGTGQVTGIEVVDEPLGVARAAAADRGDARTRFLLGDAYALDFADGEFDVVHAHQVLQHLADPVAALREMRRVTKPGGLIAVRDVDYGTCVWAPQLPALDHWLAIYDRVARSNDGEPNAGRFLRRWARAAGLDETRLTASAWIFATPDEREWWGSTWAERATRSRFAEDARARGIASAGDLQQIADAWSAWAEDGDAEFVMTHVELLARV
ncbi:methyltransferase domain-containing protein [Pseudoclavibacter terrae]|uniref:methyltransferase domain-containing protein n=1 Tax=Pseudoclavibacter terrae TaxID=1530195 RepID=UPI00232EE605|nr:methyltransferase domain-containing protein [Pseudoclavibacter terrae]